MPRTAELKTACYNLLDKVDDGQQLAADMGMKDVLQHFKQAYDLYDYFWRDERTEIEYDEYLILVNSMKTTSYLLQMVRAKLN